MAKQEKNTFTTKVFECAGNDPDRPALQCVYFKGGFAYATDGSVCIKQTLLLQRVLNPENLEGKALHRESYKDIMGFEVAECLEDGINCYCANGQKVFFDYYELSPENPAPEFDRYLKSARGQTSLDFIGIDPASFEKVCDALYAPDNEIRVQFTGVDSHIIVDCPAVEGQTATMMPRILQNTLF